MYKAVSDGHEEWKGRLPEFHPIRLSGAALIHSRLIAPEQSRARPFNSK
jgi:hypothetical protein